MAMFAFSLGIITGIIFYFLKYTDYKNDILVRNFLMFMLGNLIALFVFIILVIFHVIK